MKTFLTMGFPLSTAAALFLAGCTGIEVVPKEHEVVIPSANEPLLLTLALEMRHQRPGRDFPDAMPHLHAGLERSHTFRTVVYPRRVQDKIDGRLVVTIRTRHGRDENTGWKTIGILGTAFLATPFIEYEEHRVADCTVDLMREGRVVKTYVAHGEAKEFIKFGSSGARNDGASGVESSIKLMSADLVRQLQGDRALILRELGHETRVPGASKEVRHE